MFGQVRRSGGRRFVAALLIFALMLQTLTVAAAAVRGAAGAADIDPSWLGFEICHHDGSTDDGGNAGSGGVPDRSSNTHCIFCFIGGAPLLEAPLYGTEFHAIIFTVIPWIFPVWRLPTITVDASARPRGPPSAA